MYIKRHPQACIEIRHKGQVIFIDPGAFGMPDNIEEADAIFVTHSHFDHIDIDKVKSLATKGGVCVYGPHALSVDADFPVFAVKDGDNFYIDDVYVEILGSLQDVTSIYDPPIENVGFLIDGKFLHPGDALPKFYDLPVVAIPMAAPWAKNSDIEKYLADYKPKGILTVHDITLNELGVDFALKNLKKMAENIGADYYPLKVGEDINI